MPSYETRTRPNTTYTSRDSVSTEYSTRSPILIDLGHLLNENNLALCDENGKRILFHTGIFYPGDTLYTSRIIPA